MGETTPHAASIISPDTYNETDGTTLYIGKGPHIKHVPLQSISKLAPYSALILCVIFVLYFITRFYLLEGFVLRRIYGKTYTQMDETTRRGFVNHHIAGGTKLAILVLAAYPFIDVAFLTATLHSPFAGSKHVTMGDILIIAAQALIAMYIFELFYRPKISPVSVLHHVGTIMIGQSAIAISLNLSHEKDATIEFILCTVWGAFDIISEFLPHVSIILYRVYPKDHKFLRKLFRISAITTVTGTTCETILIFFLFGSLWSRWTIAFKVTTPILHMMFAAAQVWGSFVFFKMYKKQCAIIAKKEKEADDLEASPRMDQGAVTEPPEENSMNSEEQERKRRATITVSERGSTRDGSEIELTDHAGRAS